MKVVSIAGKRLVLSVLVGGIGLWLVTIGYGLFFTQAYYSQQEGERIFNYLWLMIKMTLLTDVVM